MASLRFFLDRALANRKTRTVYLRYKTTQGSVSFWPQPPVLVEASRWDGHAQKVKGTSLDALKANESLKQLLTQVENAVKKLRGDNALAPDPAPKAVQAAVGVAPKAKPKAQVSGAGTPFQVATVLPGEPVTGPPTTLPQLLARVAHLRASELTDGTVGQYTRTRRSLLRCRPVDNPDWLLSQLTPGQLEHWRQWLVTPEALGGEDVDNQTANNRVKLVLAAVNYLRRYDADCRRIFTEDHREVLKQKFKQHKKQRQSLTAAELLRFYHTPLPDQSRGTAMLLRDVYCLGWCTSLRQSDLFSIEHAHLLWEAGVPVALDTTSIKALKATRLPLNPLAQEIVLRWLGREQLLSQEPQGRHLRRFAWPASRLLPFVGERRRTHLRDLWQQLGLFTEQVEVVRLSGGRQQRLLVPRYELLSLHTARHGFGNHMATSNVPIEDVMLLMGHANMKTTEIYYHRPEQQAFERAQQALNALKLPEVEEKS